MPGFQFLLIFLSKKKIKLSFGTFFYEARLFAAHFFLPFKTEYDLILPVLTQQRTLSIKYLVQHIKEKIYVLKK